MSATPDRRDHLAGLTLDAVLAHGRIVEPPPPPTPPETSSGRRLVDMIRDEDPVNRNVDHKDKSSWQIFRDRLRMKRAGAAWTSSVNIPASDIPILPSGNHGSQLSRRSSVRLQTSPSKNLGESTQPGDPVVISRPQFMRRTSTRLAASAIPTESTQNDDTPDISMPSEAPPSRSFRPQMSRGNSTRLPSSESDEPYVDPFEVAREKNRRLAMTLAKEKAISAREAVAAQEAAEAEAAAAAAAAEAEEAAGAEEAATGTDEEPEAASEEPQAAGMSLLDLLDTMGFEEEEEEEEEESAGVESTCCVCMVRHKGAALIPCGHTFCRLCSRELRVQRGSCPLCNSFILEILDIF
ncbi:uncharacterized protein LOC123222678 [Mangifera indica]|uniref:uncharacterized protein LOC123222678 n=1 Tax=Mangifera indica TaxID=29780 RepID=UPI001CFAF565|nr:uncharacterized protein LOC123222678 [Mangifera indica]XP_044501512.1 uncharacterized protein LOC123222678 [Mangifera indica]XP_044501513.1 uncharacterized protein LOC123222678 [Mangifera indica]XP_044501514.1 uncharacterized protein LOC123222678 [Mangifera indica]